MEQLTKLSSKFNIENYAGLLPEHVIPLYIENIDDIFKELPEDSDTRKAIDTYIRLLKYYDEVSRQDSPLIQNALKFCEEIKTFLYEYAKNKYPEYNISIDLQGRIKSPVSAINKFKASINEYLQEGKNLDKLLIRDLFAFKVVVEVKDKNEVILDDDIAAPICYDIISQSLMFSEQHEHTTIQPSRPPSCTNAEIIHDIYTVKEDDIPPEIQAILNKYEGYYKDYILYPKDGSNYQSVHIILELKLPDNDVPLLFEMQLKTYQMNEHAERGPGSHKDYKARNHVNFLRVPQIFKEIDNNSINFVNMDDAFHEFFNFSPEDINPGMTYNNLLELLEKTNFENPIRLLTIKEENGNIIFSDPIFSEKVPIEVVGKTNSKNDIHLEAIALNIFINQKVKPELDELGSH